MEYNTALGIIAGAAVGDALGAPLEFLPPREPDDFAREMTGGGALKWAPGEITDDTIMSLGIQEMYLENGKYNQGTVISKWLEWRESGPKDIGNWTFQSLGMWKVMSEGHHTPYLLLRGDENPAVQLWKRSGGDDAGNGAVMRCMPTAVARYQGGRSFLLDTVYLAEDTHPDPRCVYSCVAINNILRLAGDGVSKEDALVQTIDLIPDDGAELIEALSSAPDHKWEDWGNEGYTIDTVKCAVASWYQNDSFEEGLVKVVNRGNDADTVGAVAGSLLGAYHGFDSIPERWWNALGDSIKQRLQDNTTGLLKIGRGNQTQ